MTDRELLELAAKAAGVHPSRIGENSVIRVNDLWVRAWNPLIDGADTLELEITLNLTAIWEPMREGWSMGGLAFHEDRKRATTLAAAEIGKLP